MPYVDFQSFFSVLTQISPDEDTLGWKILVAIQPEKYISFSFNVYVEGYSHFGGEAGNSDVKLNLTRKYPPA